MSLFANVPNGFSGGLLVRGMPLSVAYPGKVYWLNNSGVQPDGSTSASDGNTGAYDAPWSTLNRSAAKCRQGDIIMCAPGHAETISSATALTLSQKGIAVVGCGWGNLRPTFTLNTGTTSTINIAADDMAFVNCLFKANFAAIVSCFTLSTAKNLLLQDCEFRDNANNLNFKYLVNMGATANACDGLSLIRCNRFGLGATSGSAIINGAGSLDRHYAKDCYFTHAATSDAGYMPLAAGKVATNLWLDNCIFNLTGSSSATTGVLITTNQSTNSGVIKNCSIQSLDDTSPILVTASSGFIFYNNLYSSNADKSGFLLPAVDS